MMCVVSIIRKIQNCFYIVLSVSDHVLTVLKPKVCDVLHRKRGCLVHIHFWGFSHLSLKEVL